MRCLRYVVLLLVVLPSALSAQAALNARDPRAEALLRGWVAAAGGRNVWDAIHDIQFTITTVWYDSTGTERRRRPRQVWIDKEDGAFRVRVERAEAEGRYVQVWDGRRAWATLNGARLADTARAVTETEYVAGDLSYWIGLPWKLFDPGVFLHYLETDPNADGRVLHASFARDVGLNDGDRFWYYFKTGSAFPAEVHYIEQGHPESDRTRVTLDRWGALQRARYIEQRTIRDGRGAPLRALIVSDVRANVGLADSIFIYK
jgi:hypothetical protein